MYMHVYFHTSVVHNNGPSTETGKLAQINKFLL